MARMILLGLCLLLCGGLCAKTLNVGDDAPNFKARGKVIFPPEFEREFDDCEGNVILIHEWNIRDGSSQQLADIQKKFEEYGGFGLSVWTIHRLDYDKWPKVESYARDRKYTFPIAMGTFYDEENDFFGYKHDKKGALRTTVVDMDGKVVYYGDDKGWIEKVDEEVKRITYPNLGKQVVAETMERGAKHFAKREFGKALLQAEAELAKEETSALAKEDAELIIEKANDLVERRNERIKEAKEDRRWDIVWKTLELLEEEFKTHEISTKANEDMKELKKDKQIKKELKAFEQLETVHEKHGTGDWVSYVNALRTFGKANDEYGAGQVALSLVKKIEFEMEE